MSSGKRIYALLFMVFGFSVVANVYGQDAIKPHHEYQRRVKAAEQIGPLKSDLFGDTISLYDQQTTFQHVDIDLPGNDSLPVRLGRLLKVDTEPKIGTPPKVYAGIGDWDIDVPYITGVFDSAYGWNSSSGGQAPRCSTNFYPKTDPPFDIQDIWSGYSVHVPGRGTSNLMGHPNASHRPSDGQTRLWLTREFDSFSCTPMVSGYPGEGFVMLTTEGVKYTFNIGTTRYAGSMGRNSTLAVKRPRIQVYLLASRIEDRFGNYVDYTYDGNGHPTQIASSDGRSITLAYTDGRLTSAIAHGRQWNYEYVENRLSRVVLPDQSAWAFTYQSDMRVFYGPWDGAGCDAPPLPVKEFGLTLAHPSGAIGVFNFALQRHFRSGVPQMSCVVEASSEPLAPATSSLAIPNYFDTFSLVSKEISGPGLPLPSRWEYAEFSEDMPLWSGQVTPCMDCPPSKLVVQSLPDGSKINETYGIVYALNEGKLLKTQILSGSNEVLNTETLSYVSDAEIASQPFPNYYGSNYGSEDDSLIKIRPLRSRTISRQGVNFTWQANTFDTFARPVSITKASTLPGSPSRVDVTTYADNSSKWVLGQIQQIKNVGASPNVVLSRTEYDPATALPLRSYGPDTVANGGILQQTVTYNANGTIATIKDGNNNVIQLSDWYRGIPKQVQFPSTAEAPSGASQSVVVNPSGWITSVTDMNGYSTSYGYDAMGRISSVTYPAADSTSWNTTTQLFEKVVSAEYGIAAGHWRQTISTGNARKINYFDAQWRPLVTREFDVANEASTKRFQRFTYDHDGRVTFASYPGTSDALSTGVWTIYDALGRTTSVSQDSEQGLLTSTTLYEDGFTTLSTNPRNVSSTTSFLAYDQPTTELPLVISQSGASTQIARDPFGKPTSITRAGDGLSVVRSYVYDQYQRLCKTIEPESDATVMSYDNAGNVVWTASGQNYPSTTTCNTTDVAPDQRIVRSYDGHNRLSSLGFPDGNGNQNWTYTKDGLPATVTTFNELGTSSVSNSYVYNKRRMLTGESLVVGMNTWNMGTTYNGNGHVASMTLPGVGPVDFAPNALGQPTQAGSYAGNASYYPNGAIKQFTYGNGITHYLTQNSRVLPQRSWDTAGAAAVHDNSLSYDRAGNVAAILDGLPSARGSRSMVYDNLDRLTRTDSAMFGVAEYGYNALDDLVTTKVTGGSSPRDHVYVYDTKRRLSNVTNAVGGASVVGLSYDDRGNLKNKNGVLHNFDYGNRLRSVSNAETYQYDSYGRRVKAVRPAASIYSFYDQAGVLRFQRDEPAGKSVGYVHLGGSLVARVTDPIPLSFPTLTAPGYSPSGNYTASWSSVSLATRYEFEERVGTGAWALIQGTAAVSRAFSGKAANSYGYRVRGCSAVACGNWSAEATVMVELAPATAPSLSVPTTGLNGGYTVSWGSVAAASSYTLQQSFNGGGWTDAFTGAAFSKVFSGQSAGSYSYTVKACNPAGCGPASSVGPMSVINPPTSAPALSVPASSYSGSYSVGWSGVTSATRYELVEQVNGGGWTLVLNADQASMSFSGKYAASWGYQVRACNAAGCGPYSPTGEVRVTLPPASAPGLTAPAANYTGSFVVSWNAVGASTYYELQEQLNGGAWNLAQSSLTMSKTVAVGGAGLWGYRVRACNVAGCSGYSGTGTTQVVFPPGASPALSVPATSPSGLYSISWGGVASATTYELQEQVGGGAWTTVVSAAATSYSPVAKPNGTYGYRVRACNAAGCSAYSATQSIVVQLLTPGVPTGLTVTQQSATNCRIKWNAVSGATNYMVDLAGTLETRPGTQYLWDGLCPYPIRVAACNSYGCSAWAQ